MMDLKLVFPSLEYWESYLDSFESMDREGLVRGMHWDGTSSPEDFFQDVQDLKNGRNLGDLVPASNFWIISNDEYVGRMSVRHELNEWLKNYGGHIGYEVKPAARKQGIASKALSLALDYCKTELALRLVNLTCSDNNIASIKTIERNGGVLIEKKVDFNNRLSRHYTIDLKSR